MVSSTSVKKCVNRKLSISLFMIKESGANHLPPESSMDLFISLCIRITDGIFFSLFNLILNP